MARWFRQHPVFRGSTLPAGSRKRRSPQRTPADGLCGQTRPKHRHEQHTRKQRLCQLKIGSSAGVRYLDLSAHSCDAGCRAHQRGLLRSVRRRRLGLPHLKLSPATRWATHAAGRSPGLRITAADSPSRSMTSGVSSLPLAAYSCGYSQG